MAAIPITIYLVQTQLQTQTQATPNTTLAFSPSTATAGVGESVSFDIIMSPGNNQVNNVRLVINFDPTKLSADETSFNENPSSNLTILEGPVVGTDTISVSLSIGSDPTKVITTDTNIGTVTFNIIGPSELPTDISFDQTATQIRSINGANDDSFNENVFLSGSPANVTVLSDGEAPAPSLSPAPDASTSPSPIPTIDPNDPEDNNLQSGASEIPVCSSLGMDVASTGEAPYTINFTASGTDIDGVIEVVSFDFGDGFAEDVIEGGGIGTDTVDVTIEHTYDDPGDYTVTATLVDDTGESSDIANCTTNVTITDEFGNTDGNQQNNIDNTDNTDTDNTNETLETTEPTPTPLPPTGPEEVIVGVGVLGALLVIIGSLLFFAL